MAHPASGKRLLTGCAVAATTALTFAGMPPVAHAAPAAPAQNLGKLSDYRQLAKDAGVTITQNRWFVQTDGAPATAGGDASANQAKQNSVKQAAQAKGLDVKVDAGYTDLWNGMAVTVPDDQVETLAALPGVTNVFPIVQVSAPKPVKGTQTDVSSQIMTGVNTVREQYGYTGKDIKVGVIDSGIDLDHPDLGGDGQPGKAPFPNRRVKYGYDFVGDKYDASGKQGSQTPTPDPVPDDCGGHGSHVAGIIGADGNPDKGGVRGVAPDVTFGAYRIFGCEGNVDSDIILKAMEAAAKDKMDIVNMSLGWSLATWPSYPEAVAADNLVDRGVIVVDSMGNDGEKGTFTGGAPGVSTKSIAVASVENTTITSNAFMLNGSRPVAFSASDNVKTPTSGSLDIVSAGPDATVTTGQEPVGGCDAAGAYGVDPSGKALLVKRGSCSFYEKALKAQKAGAKAVIIYNRDDSTLSPSVTGAEPITIPVMVVSLTNGKAIQAAVASGQAQLTFGPYTATGPNPQGGVTSTFSSYGLTANLALKPDVAAPGGNIWSSYPLEKGGYTNMSGTSMASPHVAGAIALLLQAHPEYKGRTQAVRDLLQNTSTPLKFHLAPEKGVLESVHQQGSGLINIADALAADQHVFPGKLSIGDDRYGLHLQLLRISNDSDSDRIYTLSSQSAVGTSGDTGNPEFQTHAATVSMPKKIVVWSHTCLWIPVYVASPKDAVPGEIYGGYITVASGDHVTRVPFAGMKGDYQSLKVLQNATDGTQLPALAKLDPAAQNLVPTYPDKSQAPTFNLTDNKPGVAFHLEYPAQALWVNVYWMDPSGKQKKFLGTIDTEGKLGRDTSYLALQWDGTYDPSLGHRPSKKSQPKTAKTGNYVFEIKVQTPQQYDWQLPVYQYWTSPTFHLDAGQSQQTAKDA